jgi:threonine/homoserine/homoserine lactone efflux protein
MQLGTMAVFAATVLPLVCTPGPDILFVASQGLSGGTGVAMRANLGILGGYAAHAVLGALGVAALVAASPLLFETVRWGGVAYLVYLSIRMLRSASRNGQIDLPQTGARRLLAKGFMTSFLNPKGMLVYLAILPNFIHTGESVASQAIALSTIFISSCAIVYALVGVATGTMGRRGTFSDVRRRWIEGTAGGLLLIAAGRLAAN